MFRAKICGITNVEDAKAAARAGADAIGLNFYRGSLRYIAPKRAKAIVDALPDHVVKVGVFLGSTIQEVCDTFDQLGLDLIQIHGSELPEFLVRLGKRPVMRTFRVGPDRLHPMDDYLRQCSGLGCIPKLVLIDTLVPGVYGGTGQVADWDNLKEYPLHPSHPPMVLAGGLTPQNVADAIRVVRPAGVDVASGVETSPGKKSSAAVASFVRAALGEFERAAAREE